MKKVLKKILKSLLIVLIFCIVYYLICLIRSSILLKDFVKALELNNTQQIEEFTGNNFFTEDSIHEFKEKYINEYECFWRENKHFSYEYIGIKPYYNYILFEYEIKFPDSEWILENGEKTKELADNKEESILNIIRKQNAIESYFDEVGNLEMPYFLVLHENYEDWYGETHDKLLAVSIAMNLKNIMSAVKYDVENTSNPKLEKQQVVIAYNIFTNKFETDGLFYYAARGFLSAQETVFKFNEEYRNIILNQYPVYLYNNNNNIICLFYEDDLIWLKDYTDAELKDKNIYFICNNVKKDEIIKSLEDYGYFESDEELLFRRGEDNDISVYLKDAQYLWTNYEEKREYFSENNLSKEEIIECLKNEGFVMDK